MPASHAEHGATTLFGLGGDLAHFDARVCFSWHQRWVRSEINATARVAAQLAQSRQGMILALDGSDLAIWAWNTAENRYLPDARMVKMLGHAIEASALIQRLIVSPPTGPGALAATSEHDLISGK